MTQDERDELRSQVGLALFVAAVWAGSWVVRAGLAMARAVTGAPL